MLCTLCGYKPLWIFITILYLLNWNMVKVEFYKPDFVPDGDFTYSVINALYLGKWVFVRHVERDTWEIPGGHIEEGETPDEAAGRELYEETGALTFSLHCVATYSVTMDNITGWGRLYFAEITEIGPVNDTSEIDEVIFQAEMPQRLTYPSIQPHLFMKVMEYIQRLDR